MITIFWILFIYTTKINLVVSYVASLINASLQI